MNSLFRPADDGVRLLLGNRAVDLEYSNGIASLSDIVQDTQCALNRLMIGVSRYATYFKPWKCKALLQNWQEPLLAFNFYCHSLELSNRCKYFSSLNGTGGVKKEIIIRNVKAREVFKSPRCHGRLQKIYISLKGRAHNTTVHSLYGARWLSAFDRLPTRSTAQSQRGHGTNNDEVRRCVEFWQPSSNPILKISA